MVLLLEVLFIIVLGLVVGSFLGALTWRLPRQESVLTGRSKCDKCHKKIAWFDNIPVISFFLLRGKCRICKEKISIRYPLIEILTALVCFLVYYLTFPNQLYFFYLLILSIFLVSVLVVDFEHKIIPDQLVFPAYLLVVLFLFLTNDSLFFQHLFWGFLAALFLLLVNLLTKGKGMGLGDVKLALVGGTFFGWPLALIWLFLAFLTGALIGIILILVGKAQFGKKIAFGPFLVVSFFLAILCKDFLIRLII